MSVVILALACQQNRLSFRRMDGSVPPSPRGATFVRLDAPPPEPNVAAAHGLGPALVDPPRSEAMRALGVPPHPEPGAAVTLGALGLVAGGAWTAAAETVLWRERIPEWGLDPTGDARFATALDHAVAAIPDDLRDAIARAMTVTEAEVERAMADHAERLRAMRAKHGPKARLGPEPDPGRTRSSLRSMRRHDLDWLFFRRWRLADGWLPADPPERPLGIFHDPLAIAMRRAVVARLHPNHPDMAEP